MSDKLAQRQRIDTMKAELVEAIERATNKLGSVTIAEVLVAINEQTARLLACELEMEA